MTEEQKDAYRDCVCYLRNFAKESEIIPTYKKFCYDITKKAEFLLNLKSHLFPVEVRQGINEEIEKYNCKEFRWDKN